MKAFNSLHSKFDYLRVISKARLIYRIKLRHCNVLLGLSLLVLIVIALDH